MRRLFLGPLFALLVIAAIAPPAMAQQTFEFKLGFKTLADLIPNVVGQPIENEHHTANGDAIQGTTTGMMVWRKADNFTAFTNGSTTWIDGPFGLQERPNAQRFPWETAVIPAAPVPGQAKYLFGDSFSGGTPQLQWVPFPYFNLDNVEGARDTSSPAEDKGVGVLTNDNAGGFASLSYVTKEVPADFYLESWVQMTVTPGDKGPLNGLVFRTDPAKGGFYRVASNFAGDRELNLAYVGPDTDNLPQILAHWKVNDLPGGAPTATSWHRLGIMVVADQAEVYWDGVKLPGGPFDVSRVPSGFVGAYATFTGGLGHAETKVDDFRVWGIMQ